MDLACFADRFNGLDMHFGALGGVNTGDSTQPIYAINGYDSQATTGALASITKTDFQQRYFGVYATASKDRWVDLAASYHDGACGFVFADQHAEVHKWKEASTRVKVTFYQNNNFPTSGQLRDITWMIEHSSARRQ